MVGVPDFVRIWLCGPSARIGWPLPCFTLQRRDDLRPEHEHEQDRGHGRPAGPEGDVAEDVEDLELVAELSEEMKHLGDFLSLPVRGARGSRCVARLEGFDQRHPCGWHSSP